MKQYLAEFLGTFVYVFSVALAVQHAGAMAPLAIGAALMGVVCLGGPISGGHYNPVVTLAVFLGGKLRSLQVLGYFTAQTAGAIAAAAVAALVTDESLVFTPRAGDGAALLVEAIFSFALVLVVLNVARDDDDAGNALHGFALGSTVAVAGFAGGPISGGVLNPAVALGSAWTAVDGAPASHTWLYVLGPVSGALLARGAYNLQHPAPDGR